MKGGEANQAPIVSLMKVMKDNMSDNDLIHIIRCCYKSKIVSDKMISDLKVKTTRSAVIAKLQSSERLKALNGKIEEPKEFMVKSSPSIKHETRVYLSPIEDE